MALISIKDIKKVINIMMMIMEKLDKIYHELHEKK